MAQLPHVVLVPGFWEGPRVYDALLRLLHKHDYQASVIPLQSTGCKSPGNPSMKDDVAFIRECIHAIVQGGGGQEVLLVLHSAGAFLGSMAIKDLSVAEREAAGKKGGVAKIVFLAGAILPEGSTHGPAPFFEYKGNEMYCVTPEKLLFNDLSAEDATEWCKTLSCQPSSGWDDTIDYAGWEKVPSVYLIAEGDAILSKDMQLEMAKVAGSEVERCSAGHCCMIGQPEKCMEVVLRAMGELLSNFL
ncbi:hypothetical protein G7Y79_00005g017770 [Physcia stellaris]|nr:hypothetical protein G7Y79_00005g017770 [Physcia stellaris]